MVEEQVSNREFNKLLEFDRSLNVTDEIELSEIRLSLESILSMAGLSERHVRIIFLIHVMGYSYKEIGKELGVTGSRVRQIEKQAYWKVICHLNYLDRFYRTTSISFDIENFLKKLDS